MKLSKIDPVLLYLCCISVLLGVAWIHYVGFVRDDAYITFRYAENISQGLGFVYNPGERVYGTSSPGFTLLIAVWLKFFPNPLPAAWGLNIISLIGCIMFLWGTLEHFSFSRTQRIISIALFLWSDKVLLHFMEGMETGLVVACMLGSLYFTIKGKSVFAGFLAGLMLWLRMDSALWIVALFVVGWWHQRRGSVVFLLTAMLVYSPWLIFADRYFGSVLPLTAIAKDVAYGVNTSPLLSRAGVLFRWMSPFTILDRPALSVVATSVTILVAAFGAWKYRTVFFVRVVALFFITQASAVVALNMTVEQRYMTTALCALLVLFGLGVGSHIADQKLHPVRLIVFGAVYLYVSFWFAQPRIHHFEERQEYVNSYTLRKVGRWFRNNIKQEDTVFLEPLGYVGYYSNSKLLDEVGLLTVGVSDLKKLGLNPYQLAKQLNPDYIVFHCDDALKKPDGFEYKTIEQFDPLGFTSNKTWHDKAVQRTACYEILVRIQ